MIHISGILGARQAVEDDSAVWVDASRWVAGEAFGEEGAVAAVEVLLVRPESVCLLKGLLGSRRKERIMRFAHLSRPGFSIVLRIKADSDVREAVLWPAKRLPVK